MCHQTQQLCVLAHVHMCVCSFSVCLHVLPVGPDAKQPAVLTCMALGFSAWTLDPSCSCMTPTTSHHTASHVYAFLLDTGLVISNCQIQIQESDSLAHYETQSNCLCPWVACSTKICLTLPK